MAQLTAFKSGNHLEYLVAGMFQSQGYLTRRSVALTVDNSGADATDIDMLGIKFTRPFQANRVICDCKDKARSKPFERILWAKGLSAFVGVSDTYVALPKASRDVVQFAKIGNVRVLPIRAIDEVVNQAFEGRSTGYGLANEQFYTAFFHAVQPYVKSQPRVEQILTQIRRQTISPNPYVAMNNCFVHMRDVVDRLSSTDDHLEFAAWRFVASEIAVVVAVLLLYIAGDTLGMSRSEREHRIGTGLTYGDMSPAKAEQLFRLTQRLAFEAAGTRSPIAGSPANFDIDAIAAPAYTADVCGLVERALNSPDAYHEFPQVLDALLFEFALQDREFSPDECTALLRSLMTPDRVKAARNVLAFLQTTCGFQLGWVRPVQRNAGGRPEPKTYTDRVAMAKAQLMEDLQLRISTTRTGTTTGRPHNTNARRAMDIDATGKPTAVSVHKPSSENQGELELPVPECSLGNAVGESAPDQAGGKGSAGAQSASG